MQFNFQLLQELHVKFKIKWRFANRTGFL